MKDSKFLKRLRMELPRWVKLGWIQPEFEQSILNDAIKGHHSSDKKSIHFFALMGFLLLTAGIVLFFASNWPVLSKINKILILFISLWITYGIAAYVLIKKSKTSYFRWLGEILLLFGSLLFGIHIFLIAQIYHIDAHFPNGLLLWSLGTWLVGILFRSKLALSAGLLLAILWSWTESAYFLFAINWLFIPVFLIHFLPILKYHWRVPLHLSMIVLIFWLTTNLAWVNTFLISEQTSYYLFYLNVLILLSLGTLLICLFLRYKLHVFWLRIIEHYAVFYLLFLTFLLTSPSVMNFIKPPQTPLLYVTILLIVISALAAIKVNHQINIKGRFRETAVLVLCSLFTLLVLNHFDINASILAILFNIFFIGLLVFLIAFGHAIKDSIYINLTFIFFALLIIARYFDMFWTLLDRSFFFIIGGVLLIVGSYYLEKKRRLLTQKLIHQSNINHFDQSRKS